MNSAAPTGDRSRSEREPRRRSPAALAPSPGCAICTPVPPPLIRIAFPAISFDCGGARYRTPAIELVAEPIPGAGGKEGEARMEEGRGRIEGGEGKSVASLSPAERSAPASILPPPSSSGRAAYSLRRGLGVWHLLFAGRETLLRPERGLLYVAWLLYHPPAQPLHALDLAAQIPELCRAQRGLSTLTDPATGQAVALASNARLQQRSLALDDAQSLRALRAKARELEAILEDDAATEPEKAEALGELEAIAEFQRQHGRPSKDAAQQVARTVRQAIRRFHANLAAAVDAQGAPHPVLRAFADHLEQHLLRPSVRYANRGGCFTYEPPPGVKWSA